MFVSSTVLWIRFIFELLFNSFTMFLGTVYRVYSSVLISGTLGAWQERASGTKEAFFCVPRERYKACHQYYESVLLRPGTRHAWQGARDQDGTVYACNCVRAYVICQNVISLPLSLSLWQAINSNDFSDAVQPNFSTHWIGLNDTYFIEQIISDSCSSTTNGQ